MNVDNNEEQKNTKAHEEKLNSVKYQKERYPCFGCMFLISSYVYTTTNQRPRITCATRPNLNDAPDECGIFKEGKYSEYLATRSVKKDKAWE